MNFERDQELRLRKFKPAKVTSPLSIIQLIDQLASRKENEDQFQEMPKIVEDEFESLSLKDEEHKSPHNKLQKNEYENKFVKAKTQKGSDNNLDDIFKVLDAELEIREKKSEGSNKVHISSQNGNKNSQSKLEFRPMLKKASHEKNQLSKPNNGRNLELGQKKANITN